MATTGPEDRERFARREELEPPFVSRREAEAEAERTASIKVVAGGSITEALCGLGTVVLAIVGLAGLFPAYMAAIATIAFGVALLAQGGAIAARWSRLIHETVPREWGPRAELGGGMGAEFIGGAAGVVLGILGLLGIGTPTLIPVAVIVFGGALLIGTGATTDLGTLVVPAVHERFSHAVRQATVAASGAQVLLGIAAIVLGIIALVGVDPLTASLVALIVTGASALFTGGALGTRMTTLMRR